MSQMATARALPRSGATKAPRPLRLIAPAPPGHAGLVATCLVLLTAGFVAVLLLNTSMATGAFTVSRLQDRANELSDTRTALQHAVDAQSAPAELAKRALDLGMVPSTSAAFLRISDGQVLGVAEPAAADTGFTVVAQAGSARAAAPASPATPAAPAEQATAAAPAAPPVPESGTTVTTEGTVTRTTVTMVRGDVVESTVTSVDSATGATTSTTSRTPIPATPTAPESTPAQPAPPAPTN